MVLYPVLSKLVGKRVVLASASPRRREILCNVGLRFEIVPSWFKETLDKSSFAAPYLYAIETAQQKAVEVAKRMHVKYLKTPDLVIGADTIVTIENDILEKPSDKQDAYRMLSRLSGKEHSVFTGVALVYCDVKMGAENELEFSVITFYEETKVKFADLSEELLWEYIDSGEPLDKAGGYGIQALGGMLVEWVHGDFLNVVGFPLNHFCKKLGELHNPPTERPIQRIKYDSIPYVETFEGLSDTEPSLPDSKNNLPGHLNTRTAAVDMVCIWSHGNKNIPESQQNSEKEAELIKIAALPSVASVNVEFPHRIAELLDGFKASKALFAASKLKVFDILACQGALTASQMADKVVASVSGMERLLDSCVALGLLEKNGVGESLYYNSALANLYLVSDSDYSLHGYIIHSNDVLYPLFTYLESAVREGTNRHHCMFGKNTVDLFKNSYNDTDVKLRFMTAMHSIARFTAKDVTTAFDLSKFKTACDLGGCTGAFAHELVNQYREMRVTVFDLPDVIEKVNHFIPTNQQDSQIFFTAGDFFKDDLPEADLYILARILHDISEEKVHMLLKKIYEVCKPGGGLLISEIILDEDRVAPLRVILQSLSMTPGKQRNGVEYKQLVENHGFTQVQIKHTGNFLDAILCIKQ